MHEQQLTLPQNTCATRIFLNTFGLILGSFDEIDENSKIKIFDRQMNEVGILYFNDGKIIITANFNGNVLEANYDLAKAKGFIDFEDENALFGCWASKIAFKIQGESNIKLSGEFLIDSSIDSEFGIKCRCHPLINIEVPNKGEAILTILRDGKTFGLDITSKDYKETICIMPWDDMNGFIEHIISKGAYDPERYEYEYRKYDGVFSAGVNNKDKLHVFLLETEWDNQISYRNEFPLKAGDDKSEILVIQKGLLMQELDPDMYEKIEKLRKILMLGEISLLDNLISVCYDSYTDEELSALLAIKRQKMIYQDGSDNLRESYFGTGNRSLFLPLEQQKRFFNKKE